MPSPETIRMPSSFLFFEPEPRTDIVDRRLVLCPTLAAKDFLDIIHTCARCGTFYLHCRDHTSGALVYKQSSDRSEDLDPDGCHHFRIAFSDGACRNNGRKDAESGIGVAFGVRPKQQFAFSVDEKLDSDAKPTNQRAELRAAVMAIDKLKVQIKRRRGLSRVHDFEDDVGIVLTDSEYVVKGVTEWMFGWKLRGWRLRSGREPANYDLWLRIDQTLTAAENDGIKIGLRHIPRKWNSLADYLSKLGAGLLRE